MLNIYIGKNNLPTDKVFFFDPRDAASDISMTYDELTTEILMKIEKAKPQTYDTFVDRFGRGLYRTLLSTSSIILLAVHQLPNIVINGDELGYSAFKFLNSLDSGSIFFSDGLRDFDKLNTPICINSIVCNDENDLWDVYERVLV